LRLARTCDLLEIDGRVFHPEVFTPPHGFAHFDEIRQFRVLRVGERAFDVQLVLAADARAERATAGFEAAIRAALPVPGLRLDVHAVPRLDRDPSGKLRYYRDVREES
jgi:hypothetical protein